MKRAASFLLASCLLVTSTPYAWANESFGEGEGFESFEQSASVSDEDLDGMRGGFDIGGMTIEFGISTQTLINGQIEGQVNLSSQNLQDLTPQDLQQLIQAGAGNNANDALQTLANNPNLLIVIQNTLNDTVIKQVTDLDLQVTGIQNFQTQLLSPILDMALVDTLRQ